MKPKDCMRLNSHSWERKGHKLNSCLTTEHCISSDSLSQSTNKWSCLRCVWLVCCRATSAATNHCLSVLQYRRSCSQRLREGWGKAAKFQSRQIHLEFSQWKMKKHLCCKKSGSLYSTPNSCHQPPSQHSSFPFPGLLTSL